MARTPLPLAGSTGFLSLLLSLLHSGVAQSNKEEHHSKSYTNMERECDEIVWSELMMQWEDSFWMGERGNS